MTEKPTGLIFDIKRFSVHDGPGIRTTVFFKGCPLRCIWCHNPEAISFHPELGVYPDKCIACGACYAACHVNAHKAYPSGEKTFHRERCTACGKCVDNCYADALVMHGESVSVDTIMDEVRVDNAFYRNSGGGVTLSGGEPLAQPAFTLALLKQCRTEGIHTALDTCGHVEWRILEDCLPYVNIILYDLKHSFPHEHKKYTGVSNRLIIENLRKLDRYTIPVEVRMLVIPGINDQRIQIEDAARLLQPLKSITTVRLLPYHRYAGSKYAHLDKKNSMPDVDSPDKKRLEEIAGWIKSFGLHVIVL